MSARDLRLAQNEAGDGTVGLGEPSGGNGDRPAQRFAVRWVARSGLAVPSRAPAVEPATASGGSLLLLGPMSPTGFQARGIRGTVASGLGRPSLQPKLTFMCVRACVFIDAADESAFLPPPVLFYTPPSVFSPLLSFSRVFWEPKRDRFWWRPLFRTWETGAGQRRFLPPQAGQREKKEKEKEKEEKKTQTNPNPDRIGAPLRTQRCL